MDKDNEVKKERKYYTSGPGKPPIFIQAILYEKKMSAIDFFHLTDACLDWEKQGDDIAVIEPLVTLLAAWGDDLIFAFHDTMAELLYSLDTQKIAGDIYKDRSFSADEFLYIRCAALINSKRYYNDIVSGREGMEIVAGFDINTVQYAGFPIFADPFEFTGECDVIIDFSNAASTERLLDYCEQHGTPVVICTTGHSAAQLDRIRAASAKIAVFRSGNMSLGINLISELLKQSAAVLGDKYDVEIIEKHHNQKLDAPSGTALMLADAVASALPYDAEYVYDRHERREKRPAHEIGISAIRGGTIVGEHSVLFCGRDEIIEIKHTALSREVFAVGAVDAAAFMAERTQPGMYDMSDVIASHK